MNHNSGHNDKHNDKHNARHNDLVGFGKAFAETGVSRTFPPEELGPAIGFDACDQFHRVNHGELEYRCREGEWEIVDPYADPADVSSFSKFQTIGELTEAITDFIYERIALEGVSAMVPEPEPTPDPLADVVLDHSALRKANEEALAALKTMPELIPATKRSDWDQCEDGNLQSLVFDALSFHDALTVLGPMAEALARRIKADTEAGLSVPAMDSRPLEAYQRLLETHNPVAEMHIASDKAQNARRLERGRLMNRRADLARQLLDKCPEEALEDHQTLAAMLRTNYDKKLILESPQASRWPETYRKLQDNL